MESLLNNIFVIIFAGQFIIGILGNGFIVLVNCIDWSRSRKFCIIDFILTCLASSRIFLLCIAVWAIRFIESYEKILHKNSSMVSFDLIWTGVNYFCVSCTTCLSVFYFLKIANFSNPAFLWMKWRIHKVLLFLALAASFSLCVCLILKTIMFKSSAIVKTESNLTWNVTVRTYSTLTCYLFINTMFNIPFVVSLISCFFLILSLRNHTRRMKGIGSKDLSTEAHVSAMKSMISFLFLFVLYYLSNNLVAWNYTFLERVEAKIIVDMTGFFYLSGHPFLLIFWNSKLKQTSLYVLRNLKHCMNRKKPSIFINLPKKSDNIVKNEDAE
ncbi:PREDICTED: taste receptor type 2 member 7-like [Elephantulus edwardii]|uniref:taste receptor type 2 member 7-like n=1 Tax=Elephantulus edwardii TaxID=28737 RepID=UPI0003F05B4C|nr:PREDICTED: taste receptor type 2 member 7-like [Elephantulus edwardii]